MLLLLFNLILLLVLLLLRGIIKDPYLSSQRASKWGVSGSFWLQVQASAFATYSLSAIVDHNEMNHIHIYSYYS